MSVETLYRWRRAYGGMELPEVKRLKQLELLPRLLVIGIYLAAEPRSRLSGDSDRLPSALALLADFETPVSGDSDQSPRNMISSK